MSLLPIVAATAAFGAAPHDGWGLGIADNANAQQLQGLFRHLEPKTFRFQVPWNANDFQTERDRAHDMIARARQLGVQQIVVSFNPARTSGLPQGVPQPSARPEPDEWIRRVGPFVDEFTRDVDVWGPANEPNAGTGWLSGAHSDGPRKLAGYYVALWQKLNSLGWPDYLLSPEFHDHLNSSGALVSDGLHSGSTDSDVRHYIAHYVAEGGGFGHYVGWHPYSGVRRQTLLSTTDLIGAIPSNVPIWITEVGALTSAPSLGITQTESQQNDQTAWLANTLGGQARVARINFYQLKGDANWDSGLTRPDGSPRPAWFTWCAFAHGINGSNPACQLGARPVVLSRDGVTFMATRGFDGAVWLRTWTSLTGWGSWWSLGGSIAGNPAIVSWRSGYLDIYARRASDGALVHRYLANGAWSDWERIGDWYIASDPVPISWHYGHTDVYARGLDGALVHAYFTNDRWWPFESLGGVIQGEPSVVAWADGRMDVYARGTDNAMHHRWFDGTRWNGWESLGGSLVGNPAAMSWRAGHNDIYVRGADNALYHRWYDNGAWSAWERIGAWYIASDPAPMSLRAGHMDVFARGLDGALIHTYFANAAWQPFSSLGGIVGTALSATSKATDTIDVFARGTDNDIYDLPFAGTWGSWASLRTPGLP